MNVYLALACVVVAIHLAFILWIIAGWLFTRHRSLLRWVHIGCVIYGIFIEVSNLPCPLTFLEQHFEARAGIEPYHQPFLLHYLEWLVYPNVPFLPLVICAVVVCAGILSIYLRRYHHRTASGW